MIRVKYTDNSYDMVCPELLDHLLELGSVAEFQRRDGWVTSSSYAVRGSEKKDYFGVERREKHSLEYDM